MERLAWSWSDWTRKRSPWFATLAAAAIFLLLYGGGTLIALAFGEPRAFFRDVRWPSAYLIVALSAHQLTRLSEAIESLWEGLRPWLARPESEIASLSAMTRPTLARFFPASAAIWIAFVVVIGICTRRSAAWVREPRTSRCGP